MYVYCMPGAASRANLDVTKNFFSNKVVDDSNRLPERAVSAPNTLKVVLKALMPITFSSPGPNQK